MNQIVCSGRVALCWIIVLSLLVVVACSPSEPVSEVAVSPRASVTSTVTPSVSTTPLPASPTVLSTETHTPTPLANEVVPTLSTTRFTRTPMPEIPPTRTPIAPHVRGAVTLIGQSQALDDMPQSIAVFGNTVLVGMRNQVVALDVSEPSRPEPVGQLFVSTELEEDVQDIFVHENVAYVANELNGVVMVEVSDPARMHIIGHIPVEQDTTQGIKQVNSIVAVSEQVVYLDVVSCDGACSPFSTTSLLVAVDVQDMNQPETLSAFEMPTYGVVYHARHSVDTVYAGSADGVVRLISMANLSLLGEWAVPAGEPITITGLSTWDDSLYVLTAGQLWELNVSDPSQPVATQTVPTTLLPGVPAVYDDIRLMTAATAILFEQGLGSLRFLNVADWANQIDLGTYGPAYGLTSYDYQDFAAIQGDYIWAIDGSNQINVLQINLDN